MATEANKPHLFKIIFALVLGFGGAAAWVIYADVTFNNQIPVQDFEFHALYPISIGLAAIITALLFDRNLKTIAFKLPKPKYLAWAALFAFVFTLVPFLFNLLLHLTCLPQPLSFYVEFVLIGLVIFPFLAIGEEIMWRGFLYTELSRFMSFPATSIIIGLLWAVWHYPLIIHTQLLYSDRPLYFVIPMFTVLITFYSFIYCYLRKVSGSVWPCILLHGLENWILYTVVQPLERSTYNWSPFFMNDIGILYVLMVLIGGLYFYAAEKSEKKSN